MTFLPNSLSLGARFPRLARFPAAGPVKLLDADAIWFTMQKNKEYQVGYREKGEGFLATYALPDFTLTSKIKIEGMPQ